MPDDDPTNETLRLDAPEGSDGQIDILRSLIPADWQPIEEAEGPVFEGELGAGLPLLRVAQNAGGKWVGSLLVEHSDRRPRTDACDSINAAALHLRQRLFTYGKELKERGDTIIEKSQHAE